MIRHGYRVSIILTEDYKNLRLVQQLKPDAILWTSQHPPPALLHKHTLVTLTKALLSAPKATNHLQVLSYDVAPFLAVSIQGEWHSLGAPYLLECSEDGAPILTTLSDHSLSLLRFRPS